jgi:hypothetical protein
MDRLGTQNKGLLEPPFLASTDDLRMVFFTDSEKALQIKSIG